MLAPEGEGIVSYILILYIINNNQLSIILGNSYYYKKVK
jgi:hypothetical protein